MSFFFQPRPPPSHGCTLFFGRLVCNRYFLLTEVGRKCTNVGRSMLYRANIFEWKIDSLRAVSCMLFVFSIFGAQFDPGPPGFVKRTNIELHACTSILSQETEKNITQNLLKLYQGLKKSQVVGTSWGRRGNQERFSSQPEIIHALLRFDIPCRCIKNCILLQRSEIEPFLV